MINRRSTVKSQILSALPGHTVITRQKNLTEPLFIVVQSLSCIQIFHDPMDCSPPSSFVQRDSLHKNIGIFTTQGSNPGLLHHRRILYHLSHQGSPYSPQIFTQHTAEKSHIFFPCHHKVAGRRLKDRKISQQT